MTYQQSIPGGTMYLPREPKQYTLFFVILLMTCVPITESVDIKIDTTTCKIIHLVLPYKNLQISE